MKISKRVFKLGILLLFPVMMIAQQNEMMKQSLPLDPAIKFGKLENGLTYYIRHNEEPKDRASFYIIQNVGAMLEEDDQNGLAHFLEHMAFNGTKHFEGKGIINYLEKYGVSFGRNINAYTSLDETVYNLSNVPTTNQSLMDSCLLILNDWSNYLLLTDEEIDAERGVIKEEWRTRRTANFRLMNQLMPFMYKGSKYAKRDVIGDLDVIENFDYEVIRQFYHDWYRTDLQAIAIVGDFDADMMEQKVIELFSGIPAVENPKERKFYELPNNDKPIIAIATDPEAQQSIVRVSYKHDIVKKEDKNIGQFREYLTSSLYTQMLNTRFSEMVQKGDQAFILAQSFYGNFVTTKDAFTLIALAKSGKMSNSITALLAESERVRRFGFTSGELDRAKLDYMRSYEKAFKEKDKRNNDSFAREYKTHFISGDPIPGIEVEFQLVQAMLPGISLAEVNKLAAKWITEENMVVTLQGPDKEAESFPNEDETLALIENTKSLELEAYKDETSDKPLIAKEPEGSAVISSKEIPEIGVTEWTLGNGLKVVLKVTDYKEDEILLKAYSEGGLSLLSNEDLPSGDMLGSFIGMYGLGDFNSIELQKMLSGKIVRVSPYVGDEIEGFNGVSSPQDFETLLQLIYLYFENPRFDKSAHDVFSNRLSAFIENRSKDPNQIFNDSVSAINANYHPRVQAFNKEYLQKASFDKIKEIYLDRFKDASDFTFIFIGNIDLVTAKPLIEKYLGGIKDTDRTETWVNNHIDAPEGFVKKSFIQEMETKKSTVYINYNDDFEYNAENKIKLDLIKNILDFRYTESIREDEGGTYGVGIGVTKEQYPEQKYRLIMKFDCDPEKADHLASLIYLEVDKLIKDGPTQVDLDKARENLYKVREENLRKNGFWQNTVTAYYYLNENIVGDQYFKDILEDISIKDLKKAANEYFAKANRVEVIMKPTE